MASASEKAWNACEFCRKRKKSCNRLLPRCSTCITKGVDCDYSPMKRIQPFPPSYFLDYRAFQESGLHLPEMDLILPPTLADSFGSPETIMTEFFQRIHWWMPIISRQRLSADVLESTSPPSAVNRLLILAMKVILWHPPAQESPDPRTRAYSTVKEIINEAIATGILRLRVLQAKVLLTVYELGHGIYPAAYLSLGACVRYGIALLVDKSLELGYSDPGIGQMEMEERRRTWWAILILDRCMQIGNPSRPLCSQNPTIDNLLPSNDEAFYNGITAPRNFTLADVPSVEMGSMARMCQAAFLLGKVYLHNQDADLTERDRQAEYWQLDRTIRALLRLSYVEGETRRMAICSQTDICFRALIALHDPGGSRNDDSHMTFTMELLKPIADSMSWDTAILLGDSAVKVEDASPLLLSWAYEAAKIHGRLVGLYGEDTVWALAQMRAKLEIMAKRWRAGEQYLELLKMQTGI